MGATFACLGELLVRLAAPGRERLLQSRSLDVVFGGAEANVAVMLARLGHHARMGSVVPANALGAAVVTELRGQGVDVSTIATAAGRMGLYFLSHGAVNRPSQVLYDRAGSAFATVPDRVDLTDLLTGAQWLHLSGITPAVSAAASAVARQAVVVAQAQGIRVSFDGNYRAQLWQGWHGDGPAVLADLLRTADVAFINELDIALILGTGPLTQPEALKLAFETFPQLQLIATTERNLANPAVQTLQGALYRRDSQALSPVHSLAGVVDRIGSGDAFAAGVLHGLATGLGDQEAVDFATAAAALKHSIPGDFNLVEEAEIREAMEGGQRDVRR